MITLHPTQHWHCEDFQTWQDRYPLKGPWVILICFPFQIQWCSVLGIAVAGNPDTMMLSVLTLSWDHQEIITSNMELDKLTSCLLISSITWATQPSGKPDIRPWHHTACPREFDIETQRESEKPKRRTEELNVECWGIDLWVKKSIRGMWKREGYTPPHWPPCPERLLSVLHGQWWPPYWRSVTSGPWHCHQEENGELSHAKQHEWPAQNHAQGFW